MTSSTSGRAHRGPSTTRASRPTRRSLVADGDVERGVLACGSGVGVSIVANKLAGVRAFNAHDPSEAEMARRHHDANVVALSGARLGRATQTRSCASSCAPSSRAAAMPVG